MIGGYDINDYKIIHSLRNDYNAIAKLTHERQEPKYYKFFAHG